MKMKLLAVAMFAAGTSIVQAANGPGYVDTDLIIGFADGSTAASSDVLINLGTVQNAYNLAATNGGVADFGNASSLLTSSQGGTLANTYWSVGAGTVAVTTVNGTSIATGAAWAQSPNGNPPADGNSGDGSFYPSDLSAYISTVSTLGTAISQTTALGTSGLAAKAIAISTGAANSFTQNEGNLDSVNLGNFGGVGAGNSEDLYLLNSSGGNFTPTDIGTFTVTTGGELELSGLTPIPEPSTYALILGALTIGFVAMRRRLQAAAI
jgi:hypothetical protein